MISGPGRKNVAWLSASVGVSQPACRSSTTRGQQALTQATTGAQHSTHASPGDRPDRPVGGMSGHPRSCAIMHIHAPLRQSVVILERGLPDCW